MGKMDGNINHFIIGKMDGTIYHLMETKIRKISHWMGKIEEHQPCKSDVIEGGLPCHEASISWVCLKIRCPSLDPLVPPEIPVKAVKVLATPLQWHSLLWSTGLKWPSVFSCFFEAKNMRIWWEYRYGHNLRLDHKSYSRVYPFLKYWTNPFWGILILTLSVSSLALQLDFFCEPHTQMIR